MGVTIILEKVEKLRWESLLFQRRLRRLNVSSTVVPKNNKKIKVGVTFVSEKIKEV